MQADPAVPYYPEVLEYTCAAVVRADVLMPVLLPAALKAPTLAVAISGALLQPPPAQAAAATVVSIGDGDTLRVRQGGHLLTVRLACIDAPETSQAPFGAQARQQLQDLAPVGSTVELRIKATDRYGRSVAELSRSGRNINQALVATGGAFVYWQYIAGCDRQTYGRLENEARLKQLGVWGVSGGVIRPWDYRAAQRRSGSTAPAGRQYTCSQIGSYTQAQVLLRQGHQYLDGDQDGEACEGLR